MFSVQELLGQKDEFFDLLEASAREGRSSVEALVRLLTSKNPAALAPEFAESRRKEGELRRKISQAVYDTFVTALEREEIETLSNALYRIPKTVEKFVARLQLTPQRVQGVDFSRQTSLLDEAAANVVEMVKSLRNGMDLEEIRALNDRMQYLEGEADKAILVLFEDLFSGKCDPVTVVVRKDLFELLEKAIDRCRDVGNVISNIALKNS
jgi:uncharacterized protein